MSDADRVGAGPAYDESLSSQPPSSGSSTRPYVEDGRLAGDSDCSETVLRIFEFLDGEMGPLDCAALQRHLDQCGPCLRELQIDRALKALVHRSCGCEPAPVQLRTRIMARISMVVTHARD